MNLQRPLADQKGMVIVITLLLLVLLSVLRISLMGISLTESNIGSNESGLKTALFAAEAGIQETMYRMRLDPNSLTDLESIKISLANAPTSAFHGVVYINGDYTQPPDGSTGVLIVHNATNTANLGNFNGRTFKGLIIADQVQINGQATIIGEVLPPSPPSPRAKGILPSSTAVAPSPGWPKTFRYTSSVGPGMNNDPGFPLIATKDPKSSGGSWISSGGISTPLLHS